MGMVKTMGLAESASEKKDWAMMPITGLRMT